jgi:putative DNA primase/helicase
MKDLIEKNIGKIEDYNWNGDEYSQRKLVTVIVNLMTKNLNIISSKGAIYIFDGKYYEDINVLTFRRQFREMWLKIKDYSESKISKEGWKETIIANFNQKIFLKINNYPHLVPFKNGYYNYDTNAFEECRKETYITTHLPLEYSENAECPLFIKTMKEILPKKKDYVKFLTFIRSCFTSELIGIALVLVGDGNNGKSSVMDFFMDILGDLACDFKISDMKKDRGDVVCNLKGKYLAVSNEIGGSYMNPSVQENIKEMITNKRLSGRAAYGIRDEWVNTTTFVFPTNKVPQAKGGGKAYYRRFDFVFFNVDFTGREDKKIFQKIFEQEGGAVISYILKNFKDESVFESDWKKTREVWNSLSNPLVEFINTMCVYCADNEESLSNEIYVEYVNWCDTAEVDEIIARDKFNKHMLRLNHTITKRDTNFWYFPNLRLITVEDRVKEIKNNPIDYEQPEETKYKITPNDFAMEEMDKDFWDTFR